MTYCENCEAIGETCCEAAKARRATNITLAGIVTRQSETIRLLREAIEAQREIVREMMARGAV